MTHSWSLQVSSSASALKPPSPDSLPLPTYRTHLPHTPCFYVAGSHSHKHPSLPCSPSLNSPRPCLSLQSDWLELKPFLHANLKPFLQLDPGIYPKSRPLLGLFSSILPAKSCLYTLLSPLTLGGSRTPPEKSTVHFREESHCRGAAPQLPRSGAVFSHGSRTQGRLTYSQSTRPTGGSMATRHS